ncbi:type VI secretion system baseplate subunit TssE [Halodesulfovibrio sp. MK-HDV]|jgi:type VI secretion system protein|uniref:type VI secretion system baseplate subunit TssE n=1 Tax=Halodesulfovibrio sp. MK-HDV TaxID=2599925 RepID=UPI00136D9D66|nr:type VI secretion system baseplate subunit TssE [Halodesulfovibrio sp. MK-HDV]KAF1077360.1 hypothetical protein MKHDV_00424 [Halodesulfovibrio sp. MK-HDV]
MGVQRLLERIRYIEAHPDERGQPALHMVLQSVLDHLGKVLNTRQGSSLLADDYGLPDFTNMTNSSVSESAAWLERSIRNVALKYEPRLEDLSVEYIQKDTPQVALEFKISGKIKLNDDKTEVVFETILEPDGRIRVME